jgi:RNA polymerase sigma-70 factor (ECF subfamily)
MSRSRETTLTRPDAEAGAAVAAAREGDEEAFASLAEAYRAELQAHCYRMLGSLEDSEDLVQETFLRAWRKRASFRGDSSFRAWLYGIATNACLDALARRPRVAHHEGVRPQGEVPWLRPYPDRLLPEAASDGEPEAELVEKETIELAFIATIQLLPPRQRAVLISRDVLGWSAAECAALFDTSVAAVNSALQRARATLKRHLSPSRSNGLPHRRRVARSSACSSATWRRPSAGTRRRWCSFSARTRSAPCRRPPTPGSATRRSCRPGSTAASATTTGGTSAAC